MPVLRMKSAYAAALLGTVVMVLSSCSGSHGPTAASVVKAQPNVTVAAPEGISVKVSGTSAVVVWSAPKGLSVPLKGYEFYLDQTPPVSVGPQVTSRKLTALTSDSHYVQVIAVTATGQSDPVAASFSVAYPDSSPSPSLAPEAAPSTQATVPVQVAPPVTVAPQAPSSAAQTLSAVDACSTAVSDFGTVDTDSGAVIEGTDDEIATGHSFGAIIVELQSISQNVADRHLAALITTATGDVISIRAEFIAGGDNWDVGANLDPDIALVRDYCSSAIDPLGNTA